jgi:nifR3 family TIM-barrel protein
MRLKSLQVPAVVQSPMANCTDLPFRLIARAHGMRFAFLEMVSAEALVRDVARTHELMRTVPEDRPLGAQLVGCDPAVMAEAAARVETMGFDLVDLNLGCPVPKVVSHGGGSMLLREPEAAARIFARVVRAVRRIPVTVKMRLGFRDGSGREAAHIARLAQDCGVDAVAVHGRTREQGYSGAADYEAIGRVKAAVSIPVIGNGDVTDGAGARRLRAISGCDGVMLGRGALGNPWIYREVQAALDGVPPPPAPDLEARRGVLLRHLELQAQHDERPVGPLRRIASWYFRDCPGVAEFRDRIHRAQSVEEMRELARNFSRP